MRRRIRPNCRLAAALLAAALLSAGAAAQAPSPGDSGRIEALRREVRAVRGELERHRAALEAAEAQRREIVAALARQEASQREVRRLRRLELGTLLALGLSLGALLFAMLALGRRRAEERRERRAAVERLAEDARRLREALDAAEARTRPAAVPSPLSRERPE